MIARLTTFPTRRLTPCPCSCPPTIWSWQGTGMIGSLTPGWVCPRFRRCLLWYHTLVEMHLGRFMAIFMHWTGLVLPGCSGLVYYSGGLGEWGARSYFWILTSYTSVEHMPRVASRGRLIWSETARLWGEGDTGMLVVLSFKIPIRVRHHVGRHVV